MPTIRKILALPNPEKPACAQAGRLAEENLRQAGFVVLEELADIERERPDLLLLFGGDGFLMETLHRLEFPETPIFGINFGTVGFLMNSHSALDELPALLEQGRFEVVAYPILEARAFFEDGGEQVLRAFNEFVLERQTGQAVRLRVSIDDIPFNRFAGDGFVISTPAGSTAYNLAAGGPAVHPRVSGLILTPLYAHRAEPFHSVQFSLMLPRDSKIEVVSEDLPKRHMRLVVDGRPLKGVERVEVRNAPRCVSLLRTPDRDFIRVLSQKFIGWERSGDIIA